MKLILSLALAVFLIGSFFLFKPQFSKQEEKNNPKSALSKDMVSSEESALFVPYWTLDEHLTSTTYDTLLYFGISADTRGIDTQDEGYSRTERFLKLAPAASQKILTVRMIDALVNADVLSNTDVQRRISSEAAAYAKEYGFDGIALDFETSALGFSSTTEKITAFYKLFSAEAQKNKLLFYAVVFGDTYYRGRPYDVASIASFSDRVVVMTYDFHKARGKAGPTFPMQGEREYGYDLETMVDDFLHDTGVGKLLIVFGMFGYDWGEGNDLAEALSYNQGKQRFLTACSFENCFITENRAKETKVTYTLNDQRHEVWFETPESVALKKEYIESRGILRYGYWAYSFF